MVRNIQQRVIIHFEMKRAWKAEVFGDEKSKLAWRSKIDWLQSLKQFFINVSYHILVASPTLMALS